MEKKIELIEKYLEGEMSVREQTEFENLLRSDPDMMKEYLLRKDIYEAVSEDDIINLRSNLDEILNQENRFTCKLKNPFVLSSVAAVLLLLIITAKIFLFSNKEVNEKDVFESFYSAYPAIMSFRSPVDQSDQEKLLYNAFNLYDEGNFDLASEYLLKLLKNDDSNTMAQFYLSICEIEKDSLKKSENYLNDLILKKNHIFWEQSHWYLALVYLEQDDVESARLLFEKIIKENRTQKSDAELILKSLN